MNSNLHNKILHLNPRDMRKDMTTAEALLWKYVLKLRQMRGYQFRRQNPVLSYIATFMCPDLKLIVEVDDSTRQKDDIQEKVLKKDFDLVNAGYHVLRLKDKEVLNRIWKAARCIEQYIEEFEKSHPPDGAQREGSQ
jgi:very-short-patch-repair endonuclease